MNAKRIIAVLGALVAGIAVSTATGCSDTLWRNQTAARTGNISIIFINETAFRASFSSGTYDALDHTPGAVTLNQQRLEAHTTTAAITDTCRRNFAIGTQEYVQRVLDTKSENTASFDPDAFDTTVHFSSAPVTSDGAALPDAGTAVGVNKLLGVDFACADQLIFTFVQDPDAPGGFRIDFAVIASTAPNP